MQIVINVDAIDDASKKAWLFKTLKLMNINFNTTENRQTVEEYNWEIAEAEAEIERGEYVTAEDLKKEALTW